MTDKIFIDTNIWFYAFVTGATSAEKEKTRLSVIHSQLFCPEKPKRG